jgi:hypothetical protein
MINEKDLSIQKAFLGSQNRSTKSASLINDSVLLLGSHAYAYQYNLKTATIIDSIRKRVVSLCTDLLGNIYLGGNDGLFLWNEKKLVALSQQRKSLLYKINTMACTPDNLMWVGLGADSLIVLKNNKWVASIALGDIIPGNVCKALCSNKLGEIWLGTNKGLNRINYTYLNNKFTYNNSYFGIADGIIGEQVNDIVIQDSVLYVATNQGISYLSVNIQLPVFNIPIFITSININNIPAPLQNKYVLAYDQNDVSIKFSGVDFTGYTPFFEYRLNNEQWQRIGNIDLKRLPPGNYTIQIRAIRRDGKPSTKVASVIFEIKKPFWKNSIFTSGLALLLFGGFFYLQQRRNKQKQKFSIEKITTEKRLIELEMQALKAQINPHFIFNCLNSIKSFIYDKDFIQADKYLDKFAELMRNTIDNSDAAIISIKVEMHYLDNYLQLEKLRFNNKFEYYIAIDINVDKEKRFVPSMLLQPYVENAIRHGMRFFRNRTGQINITAKIENSFLVCIIDDDGIGREKAATLKSKMPIEYQSKGMYISQRRAALYKIEQIIIDKKDTVGNAAGTTIILKIPLTLNYD